MNQAQENINLVKSLYTAFLNKDISKIPALLHEAVEWGEPENPYNPAGGTRHGHQGFWEWINIGREAEEILELTCSRFLTDADAVAVTGHIKCRAISTQKIYESDFVHLLVIEDNKIKKFQEFFDTYTAGEAFR